MSFAWHGFGKIILKKDHYLKDGQMEEKLTEVNLAKNRIYIHFQGRLDFPRALRLQKAYREAINKVKPGFTVITFAANYMRKYRKLWLR